MLDAAGLRASRTPTEDALKAGFAKQRFDGFGVVTDWNTEKVLALLERETKSSDARSGDVTVDTLPEKEGKIPPIRARSAKISKGESKRQSA